MNKWMNGRINGIDNFFNPHVYFFLKQLAYIF